MLAHMGARKRLPSAERHLVGGRNGVGDRFTAYRKGLLDVLPGCFALWGLQSLTDMVPPERFGAANSFFEHLGLIGGFLLIAWLDLGDTDPIPGIADDHNGRVIIRAGNRLVRVATGATRRTGTVPLRTRWQPTPADRRV